MLSPTNQSVNQKQWSVHFGTPLRIHCKENRESDNTLIKVLCQLIDIKFAYSNVGHPRCDRIIRKILVDRTVHDMST